MNKYLDIGKENSPKKLNDSNLKFGSYKAITINGHGAKTTGQAANS